MSDQPPVCEHGHLRRQCEACELREENARLRALLARCREGLWYAGFSKGSVLMVDVEAALAEGGGQ